MKYFAFWCSFIIGLMALASAAQAQVPSFSPVSLVSPGANSTTPDAAPDGSPSLLLPSAAVPAEPQIPVRSVYQQYKAEAFLGYTFSRFYAFSGASVNENGFVYGLTYFPKNWFVGADGEFDATFGTLHSETSHLLLGMGGAKVRWSGPRQLEVFARGLAGVAHFSPRTAFGNEGAFGYQVGGGANLPFAFKRIGFRVGADMVATHFFSTYQYSPKIYAGLVFKFAED